MIRIRADLQVHPYPGIRMEDILATMKKRECNCVCLMGYSWAPLTLVAIDQLKQEAHELTSEFNNLVYCFPDDRWVIFGEEVATADQRLHILSVGADGIQPAPQLEELIQSILEKGGLPIIDHPFNNPLLFGQADALFEERTAELRALWQRFGGQIAFEWNGYALPTIRMPLGLLVRAWPFCRIWPFGFSDTNTKTKRLAEELMVPLIPDTDLHASGAHLLRAIGTSYIEVDLPSSVQVEGFLPALRMEIRERRMYGHFKYVSIMHFIEAWGWPTLREKVFRR